MSEFRVLIVDDEIDFLETLVKRLKKRKLDAVGVASGEKALDILDRERFDVVILDVRMPGLDGIETLKEIKRRTPLTEVIMLTGHASVESGMQGMQSGAFDYVIKPAGIDDLIEKLNQARERKLLHEERIRSDRKVP
ncbi:MAG: response regulator [Syntrophobacteraceae bacterium]|nr:response regulator [Syntrophobacteraceae bacterium]